MGSPNQYIGVLSLDDYVRKIFYENKFIKKPKEKIKKPKEKIKKPKRKNQEKPKKTNAESFYSDFSSQMALCRTVIN